MARKKKTEPTNYVKKTLRFDKLTSDELCIYNFLEKIRWYQTKFIVKLVMDFMKEYNITLQTPYEEIRLVVDYFIKSKEIPNSIRQKNESIVKTDTSADITYWQMQNTILQLQNENIQLKNTLLQNNLLHNNNGTFTTSPLADNTVNKVVQIEQLPEPEKEEIIKIPENFSQQHESERKSTNKVFNLSIEEEEEEDYDTENEENEDMVSSMLSGFSNLLK